MKSKKRYFKVIRWINQNVTEYWERVNQQWNIATPDHIKRDGNNQYMEIICDNEAYRNRIQGKIRV